jgi:hypothetical protein
MAWRLQSDSEAIAKQVTKRLQSVCNAYSQRDFAAIVERLHSDCLAIDA